MRAGIELERLLRFRQLEHLFEFIWTAGPHQMGEGGIQSPTRIHPSRVQRNRVTVVFRMGTRAAPIVEVAFNRDLDLTRVW